MLLITLFILSVHSLCDHRDILNEASYDSDTASCFSSQHTYVALTALMSDGTVNSNIASNNLVFRSAGYAKSYIDYVMKICVTCGNVAGQISSYKSKTATTSHNGVIVEILQGSWYSSTSKNQEEYETIVTELGKLTERVTILSSKNDWTTLFGKNYQNAESAQFRLIYVGDSNENFDDFEAFGGWTKADEKMKPSSTLVCSNLVRQTVLDCE